MPWKFERTHGLVVEQRPRAHQQNKNKNVSLTKQNQVNGAIGVHLSILWWLPGKIHRDFLMDPAEGGGAGITGVHPNILWWKPQREGRFQHARCDGISISHAYFAAKFARDLSRLSVSELGLLLLLTHGGKLQLDGRVGGYAVPEEVETLFAGRLAHAARREGGPREHLGRRAGCPAPSADWTRPCWATSPSRSG